MVNGNVVHDLKINVAHHMHLVVSAFDFKAKLFGNKVHYWVDIWQGYYYSLGIEINVLQVKVIDVSIMVETVIVAVWIADKQHSVRN